AAAAGLVTALVTARPSIGLWVALGLLVIIGAVLQAAVVTSERRSTRRDSALVAFEEKPPGQGSAVGEADMRNSISGGTFRGPVLQGRDFTGLAFGSRAVQPPVPPGQDPGAG
ncbi:MAG: hypothetical protein ACRDNZ_08810, partial [Streptosporangiaceae bacterium]